MTDGAEAVWLGLAFLLVALVYASVGQAGASGYIAVMGLVGMAPVAMKVTALALNLLVAARSTTQFWRAGRLSWRVIYPFAVLGFPFSLLGGVLHLPTALYYPAVGVVLVLSALLMARSALWRSSDTSQAVMPPPFVPALLTGAAIGLVSGTTAQGAECSWRPSLGHGLGHGAADSHRYGCLQPDELSSGSSGGLWLLGRYPPCAPALAPGREPWRLRRRLCGEPLSPRPLAASGPCRPAPAVRAQAADRMMAEGQEGRFDGDGYTEPRR